MGVPMHIIPIGGKMSETGSENWNLNGVNVRVNGESAGSEPATMTLAAAVQKYASSRGIRSASVFAGDRKLYTTDGSKTLQELGVTELNIVTKDQRADGWLTDPEVAGFRPIAQRSCN
jgi:hypothetical protein